MAKSKRHVMSGGERYRRHLIVFMLAMWAPSVLGEGIAISEIFFGNNASTPATSPWLEINNTTPHSLHVARLTVEVFTTAQRRETFSSTQTFDPPLSLDNYLLIAQKSNLGIDACFMPEVPVVTEPELRLAKQGTREICVTINQQWRTCVAFTNKDRPVPGQALYPHAISAGLYNGEVCEWIPGIFMTPGLPPEICRFDSLWRESILAPCALPKPASTAMTLNPKLATPPHIEIFPVDPLLGKYELLITDNDLPDLWIYSLCRGPRDGNICHQVSEWALLRANERWPLQVPAFEPGLQVQVRDLYGLSALKPIPPSPITSHTAALKLDQLPAILTPNPTGAELQLTIHEELRPLNYELRDAQGTLRAAGSFAEVGIKKIPLGFFDDGQPAKLSLFALKQEATIMVVPEKP
jgi:hypothetical protein